MNRSCAPERAPQGAALVITLFFIVLITVMVVAFLDSARMDRSVAGSHLERMRASNYAREGTARVIATLRRETVDPPRGTSESKSAYDKRTRNWVSQPGMLITADEANFDAKQLRKQVPLSSGAPSSGARTSTDPIFRPVNLNVQTLTDQNPPAYLINDHRDPSTGAAVPMLLRWVYVRQDGTYDLPDPTKPIALDNLPIEQPDLANTLNPIVGRFAFWTDDESSKINYNLAWKREGGSGAPNEAPLSHPSRINLTALKLRDGSPLTESMADMLHQWTTVTPGRYFNSFADARQVSEGLASMLDYNRFELTHYNHDPDTTFFGEDRILLTTNRDLVPKNPDGTYARKFLDIMRDDREASTLDPGILEDVAGGQPDWRAGGALLPNKLDPVVDMLVSYISKSKWPLFDSSTSFKDKFYGDSTVADAQLAQIAVNIIDYVRAKESKEPVIPPFRFVKGPAGAADPSVSGKYTIHPSYAYGATYSFQGICRAPTISEFGVWQENDPVWPPKPPTDPAPPGWPTDSSAPASSIPGWPTLQNGKAKKLFPCHYKMELYLPKDYGLEGGIDLAGVDSNGYGWFALWTSVGSPPTGDDTFYYTLTKGGRATKATGTGSYSPRILEKDIVGNTGTILNPGQYVTVTKIMYLEMPEAALETVPPSRGMLDKKTFSFRAALLRGNEGKTGSTTDGLVVGTYSSTSFSSVPRVAIVPQWQAVSYTMGDPTIGPIDKMPSMECDDPRAAINPKDWKQVVNTFGLQNSISTLGTVPKSKYTNGKAFPKDTPQQDTDKDGLLTDVSSHMPPPKGVGSNDEEHDNGRVTSIGELGWINTGIEGKSQSARGVQGSVPWRTIRLQPNKFAASKDILPDWAFMDLFAVPSLGKTGVEELYTPHGTAVGGRVNVNSHAEPFDQLQRDRGLAALFTGAEGLLRPSDAEDIANNIYHRVLATGTNFGKAYGYPWNSSPQATESNAFDTPGEICEIKGVADGGEESEKLVREVVSLITARGNVFNIYTVGQAIKQQSGRLNVTAERRQEAVVERYLDNRGTPEKPDDDAVHFRTVYARDLTP